METVIAAAVTGILALAGVIVTVRNSRASSTAQHVEQTTMLSTLVDLVQANRVVSDHEFEKLHERVSGLAGSHEALFGLVTELDSKVTKQSKRRTAHPVPSVVGEFVNDL